MQGLKEYGVDDEAIVCIMLGVKESDQTDMMIGFLLENPKATQEEMLEEMVLIRKQTR